MYLPYVFAIDTVSTYIEENAKFKPIAVMSYVCRKCKKGALLAKILNGTKSFSGMDKNMYVILLMEDFLASVHFQFMRISKYFEENVKFKPIAVMSYVCDLSSQPPKKTASFYCVLF